MLDIAKREILLQEYALLPELHKRVLQLKVIFFDAKSKNDFLEYVGYSDIKNTNGKTLKRDDYSQILQQLTVKKFVTKHLEIEPSIFQPIMQDALIGKYKESNLQIVKQDCMYKEKPTFRYYKDPDDLRLIHLAIYTNSPTLFRAVGKGCTQKEYFNNLLELLGNFQFEVPFDFMNKLDPAIQLCLCLARLLPHIMYQAAKQLPLTAWLEHYKTLNLPKVNDYLDYLKLELDLSLGRLEYVQNQASKFSTKNSPFYIMQGSLWFLKQDLPQALACYRKAFSVEPNLEKNKDWFFNDIHGAFYLFTLISQGEIAKARAIVSGLLPYTSNDYDDEDDDYDDYNSFDAFELIATIINNIICLQEDKKRNEIQTTINTFLQELQKNNKNISKGEVAPVLMALLAFAQYLVDPELLKEQILPYCYEQFHTNKNYALATHINAEILFAVEQKPIYQEYLKTSPFGDFRLLELIRVKAKWELLLDRLNTTLVPTVIVEKANVLVETKRLVWLLEPKKLDIEVLEQKQQSKGGWSKGRTISLKRLYYERSFLDYLTEQDRKALYGLKLGHYSWYEQEGFSWDLTVTLPALIGSPNIYHKENKELQLELIKGDPELNIEEVKDGYRFSLSHYANEPKVILEKENQNKYRVINYEKDLVMLSDILPRKGIIVPAVAKEQVLSLIKEASHDLIHINTNVGDLAIPTVTGDSTCWLHILPVGEGMKIDLGIRPFGEQGPFYQVGEGNTTVIATIKDPDGEEIKKRAIRNFKAEKDSAQNLIQNCPTLLAYNTKNYEWRLENVEICLEALTEIEAYTPVNVEWPQGQNFHIKQTVSAKDLTLKIKGERNWFEYDGEVALNDKKVLSMEFLLGLLESNNTGRFVKLQDGQFLALTNNFKKRLEELKAASEKNKIYYLGSNLLENLTQEVKSFEADFLWQKHIEKIKTMRCHNPKIPTTLQANLRDYQQDGFKYLSRLANWGIGACLADDMGLGKTVQAIALLLEQASKGPAIVVAPTTVCFNWIDEITKFAPTLNIYTLHGNNAREECIEKLTKNDVLICSYGLLQQVGEILIEKKWQTIVLDEAQAIKNPQTLRWKYAVKLEGNCRLALTGTPIENHLGELWSIFRYLNPGLLGTPKIFQQRFVYPIEKNKDPFIKGALKELVKPYILRRLKSEVLTELPAKTEQTIIIEPSEEEMAFYEALRRQALERISNLNGLAANNKRFSILAEITKLRQACCHSSLVDGSIELDNSKIKVFLEIVEELIENNHRALVFSQYVRYLSKIKETLATTSIKYQYIDGQTSIKDRQRAVEEFQAGSGDLFLLSLKTGGVGLNLTAADYVIHLDPWWNPAVEDQASDRAHRLGQQKPVTIYRLIIKDSIEEKIINMHKEKRDLATDLLSGGDVSGKMSEEELLELIA